MSKKLITIKYKVNVSAYCNWYNLFNLGLKQDEIETDCLSIKDASGVINYIKEYYLQEGGDELIKKHSFEISDNGNEILFCTIFILGGNIFGQGYGASLDDIKFYTNQPDKFNERRLGKWKNENGDLVNPMEIINK